MIPLKDNIPTIRFPIVTVLLIAVNLAVLGWQLLFTGDEFADRELRELGITEIDLQTIEYGAIPYRILNGGGECAVGAVSRQEGRARTEVVCEGTAEFDEAEDLDAQGVAPFVGIDTAPWWITVVTSMFLHAGILHLAGNMLFLWVFGNNIEDSMGRLRFLAFYLLAGGVAVYAQAMLEPGSAVPTIGASGAVSGVLGGYILLHPRARVLTLVIIIFFFTFIEIPALVMLGIWFALQAVPVFSDLASPDVAGGEGGIAYLAHVGGFIFGLLAIKLFARRELIHGPGAPPARA